MIILDYLRIPVFQIALLAAVLTGLSLSLIGHAVVQFKLTTIRFALMHIAILGGAIGILIGIKPMTGAMLAIVVGSMLFGPLSNKIKMDPSIFSAILTTGSLSIALMMFYVAKVPAMEVYALFTGSILTLTGLDLVLIGIVSFCVVVLFGVFQREIHLLFFDEQQADWMGIPVQTLKNIILFLVGLTIGISIKVVGALLIDAIVLLPALSATRVAKSFSGALIYASIFGVITTVGGLLLSMQFDLPTGATISMMGVIVLMVTYSIKK